MIFITFELVLDFSCCGCGLFSMALSFISENLYFACVRTQDEIELLAKVDRGRALELVILARRGSILITAIAAPQIPDTLASDAHLRRLLHHTVSGECLRRL